MNDEKIISIMDFIKDRKEKELEVLPIDDFEEFHYLALVSILPYCIVTKQENDYRVDYKAVSVNDSTINNLPLFILKPVHENHEFHYGFDMYSQSNLANTFLYVFQYLHPNMCWHCILDQYDKVSEEKRLVDMYVQYIQRKYDV